MPPWVSLLYTHHFLVTAAASLVQASWAHTWILTLSSKLTSLVSLLPAYSLVSTWQLGDPSERVPYSSSQNYHEPIRGFCNLGKMLCSQESSLLSVIVMMTNFVVYCPQWVITIVHIYIHNVCIRNNAVSHKLYISHLPHYMQWFWLFCSNPSAGVLFLLEWNQGS